LSKEEAIIPPSIGSEKIRETVQSVNENFNFFVSTFRGDKTIWTIVVVLSLFSAMAVYSSTGMLAYKYNFGAEHYIFKHSLIILAGLGLMWIAHRINFQYYAGFSKILMLLSVCALLFTLVFVRETNDAKRWIALPIINLTFQASDLAKLGLIMYVARTLSLKQDVITDFYQGFLPLMVPIVLICGLIFPENFSTACVLFFTCMILLFFGRVSWKHLLATGLLGIVILGSFIFLLFKIPEEDMMGRMVTWKHRIESFSGQESEILFQVEQANIAIAQGGIFPNGPGTSLQKNFLPHPYSDYIYAIIIEEWGLIGGAFVLFLYLLFLWRCIKIVIKTPKAFGALLAAGLGTSIVIQAMVNMGVAVGVLPVTGMTLPLVSMGGSSMFFISMALGIILSVSYSIEQDEIKIKN
jgi:cell division protein FtsW